MRIRPSLSKSSLPNPVFTDVGFIRKKHTFAGNNADRSPKLVGWHEPERNSAYDIWRWTY